MAGTYLFRLRCYYFFTFTAFGAYLPYFPEWLQGGKIFGAEMGAVLALLPLIGIVSPAYAGALADRLGIRTALLRGATVAAGLSFVTIASSRLSSGLAELSVLLVGVILFAAVRPLMVLFADVLALESIGNEHYGSLRLWGSLGFLVSALSIGELVDLRQPFTLPLVIAGLYVIAVLVSLTLPRSPPRAGAGSGSGAGSGAGSGSGSVPGVVRTARTEWRFVLAILFSQIAHSTYDACFTLHVATLGVSQRETGLLWGLGVVSEVALLFGAKTLLRRLGTHRILVVGLAGACLRWSLIALATSFVQLALLAALHAASFACVWIACVKIVSDKAGEGRQATFQGVFAASLAVGGTIGSVLSASLFERFGGRTTFLVASVAAGIAALLAALDPIRTRAPRSGSGTSESTAGPV